MTATTGVRLRVGSLPVATKVEHQRDVISDGSPVERGLLLARDMKWLLPVLLAGCVEGNEISGSWVVGGDSVLSSNEGECVGSVRIEVRTLDTTTSHADCRDGGFAIVVPYEATHVTLDVRDDWSETISHELEVDGDLDLGRLYFSHFE